MPLYSYSAYTVSGALTRGEIVGETRQAVLDALHRRGEQAIEVRESAGRAGDIPWWQRDLTGSRQLALSDLALFTRELATLVKADIPTDEALRIVVMQPLIGSRMRDAARRVLASVLEGAALSDALARTGGAIPDFHWRLVQAGEASGQLGPVLDDLAAFLERSGAARSKLGAALLYPAILLVAAAITLSIVMGILVPAMLPLFEEAKVAPPVVVAALAAAGDWLSRMWPLLAGGAALLAAGLPVLGLSAAFRLWRDRTALRVPLIGGLVLRRDTARFARSLSTMVRNGVPLLTAVETAAGALGNRALAAAVLEAGEALKAGGSLSAPLRASGLFTELSLRLVAAGEHTGQLDTMLSRVADINEQALEHSMQRLTTLLTPALTVVIGLLVGGLVISVMGALAGINELAIR